MFRIVMYRADHDVWFVYKGHFSHADYAEAHGRRMLKFQPSWDFKVVPAEAAHAVSLLLNR